MSTCAQQLIAECRCLGIELSPTDRGVKCIAPTGAMTAELQASIAANRTYIRELLLAEKKSPGGKADLDSGLCKSAEPQTWAADSGALADFVLLLAPNDLPSTPFELGPGRTIVDAGKYLQSLQADVKRGPGGPRAKLGGLRQDLRNLRGLLLDESSTSGRMYENEVLK